MLEKTLESPLDCKEIQPVHSEGDQPWDFFGRNDAKAETKSWLIGKDSDAGKDWGQEEKGTTEDEMAGWHHRLDGCESEWTPGVGDGQGGLACCNSWGRKESDTTKWLNWTEPVLIVFLLAAEVKVEEWLEVRSGNSIFENSFKLSENKDGRDKLGSWLDIVPKEYLLCLRSKEH